VDVNALVAGMDVLLGGSLGGLVTVTTDLDAAHPAARVDPDQLELAILNLCINARDAMPDGGSIAIATGAVTVTDDPDLDAGEYVTVTITDSGMGIPPEILARVCEPFFTTKSVGQGTGLGLAMVFGLTQQSQGKLRITSEIEKGTRVELFLPRADLAEERPPLATVTAPRALSPARILVVDDDAEVRHVTASFLNTFGYTETEAADGAAAVALLERSSFDLIVADLAMPGMTGVELAEIVRRRWSTVPILIVTGHAEAIPIPEDLPVLRKPFDSADLAALVSGMLVAAR
jgi:CheY-like chemotaxis protein